MRFCEKLSNRSSTSTCQNTCYLRPDYCARISCILFGNIVHTLNKEPCANIFLTVPLVDDKMEGESWKTVLYEYTYVWGGSCVIRIFVCLIVWIENELVSLSWRGSWSTGLTSSWTPAGCLVHHSCTTQQHSSPLFSFHQSITSCSTVWLTS